jgi:hypothetical protein
VVVWGAVDNVEASMREIKLDETFAAGFAFKDIAEPFWFNTWLWDIPATMIGVINAMPPTCKRLTLVRGHNREGLAAIQAAADAKGIEIMWAEITWCPESHGDMSC